MALLRSWRFKWDIPSILWILYNVVRLYLFAPSCDITRLRRWRKMTWIWVLLHPLITQEVSSPCHIFDHLNWTVLSWVRSSTQWWQWKHQTQRYAHTRSVSETIFFFCYQDSPIVYTVNIWYIYSISKKKKKLDRNWLQ